MANTEHLTDGMGIIHPITLTHGKNARVWDVNGKEYIDFFGGIGVLNFGHCHPKIIDAITIQAKKLTHAAFNATYHNTYTDYIKKLIDSIPIDDELSVMLTNCGAEAVENALKIVRQKTGKAGVIAFDGGFHGRTLSTVNLNGKVAPYKSGLGLLNSGVYHIPFASPDTGLNAQTAIDALERLINVEVDIANIGAIIVEPVQGEGGFSVIDKNFAKYLRDFCNQNDIVLIFDEIQAGFGRTGLPFAFMQLGVEPDIILLAKSIAGGLPLGAIVGRNRLMTGLIKGSLGGTYSGNPIACAAATAVLEIMEEDKIWANSKLYIDTLEHTVTTWQKEGVSEWLSGLTGIGAMRGIMLKHPVRGTNPKVMDYVLTSARNQGLLLMPSGKYRHIIRLLPPLTIEANTLTEGLKILREVLGSIPNDL
ncbi:2-aminoadipate transaminase [Moraxella catarrhalis]|uniref:Gamma-aminobutyrate:alpha-ketoglutarate aminotransferase n=3 Tax=Moraxella catarrhalis TaxID=480 RepID=A0A198UFG2_MORCA|nr:aspartate aminotransferase family protein [Moraxella catarrhalis]OAU95168.1 Gamma-aminobutyrate:alpha-ketoglutarate aminotransferase [Moraxella catarrhalis]OAU99226.1 Gamma-aminobutyrate:alpha-ketoglutarate aminotransferase [Moraxella catarrhalis]